MKSTRLVLLGLTFFFACSSKPTEIEGFNSFIWKNDKYGCMNERAEMVENLLKEKERILGLNEAEVLRLLGKPDEQEIYSRNQKFLVYFLEPNRKCTAPENIEATAKALNLRLNAIGVANELYVSKR